jgi:hypothetical protein
MFRMTPCKDKWCSLIDITNKCHIGDCLYCSRYTRHCRKDMLYEMSLEQIDNALSCYTGIPCRKVGIIGGEPILHSQFAEVCELVRNYFPRWRVQLFTSISDSKYNDIVAGTFGDVAVNEHTMFQNAVGLHQPFTLALKDMVEDENLRTELIKDCWFGKNWCGTVNINGAFHCEIAAAIAYLIGAKGWDVTPNWWEKEDVEDQIYLCQLCGACIPMERQHPVNKKQKMSPSIIQLMKEKNLLIGDYEVVDKPLTIEYMAKWAKTWDPGNYRGDIKQGMSLGSTIDWNKWEGL